MSILSATSRGCKGTFSDGSVKYEIILEPKDAHLAAQMMGMPGTTLGICALTQEAAQNTAQQAVIEQSEHAVDDGIQDSLKGGQLSKLAALWCKMPEFWEWLETDPNNANNFEIASKVCLYDICEITSRAELDHDKVAEQKFHTLIRIPYGEWLKKND